MATIAKTGPAMDVTGNYRRFVGQYTGPAAYVSGGESFPPEQLGLGKLDAVLFGMAWSGTAVRLIVYDRTNKKAVWYVPNTGSEASGDLSTYVCQFEAIGL